VNGAPIVDQWSELARAIGDFLSLIAAIITLKVIHRRRPDEPNQD
jgi:hypothetical protein